MAFYGTDFDKLLQAVASYYGRGSDQWWDVYNYYKLYDPAIDGVKIARILEQTPYVETWVNSSGEILKYSIVEEGSVLSAAETSAAAAAQSLNSNAVTVAVKELSVPGNAVINETTGVVEMSSGATAAAGASAGSKVATVAGHVGTWLIGSAVGMKLGVWIDGALYNANPDFWDSRNMWYINPENWDQTKVTNWLYDYSGYDDFVALMDEDGQLYIDEQNFALAAQYLAAMGAFQDNAPYCTREETQSYDLFYFPQYVNREWKYYTNNCEFDFGGAGHIAFTAYNNDDPVYIFIDSISPIGSTHLSFFSFSTSPFNITGAWGGPVERTTRAGDSIYYYYGNVSSRDAIITGGYFNYVPDELRYNHDFWFNDIPILLYHGRTGVGGLEGFNPYDTMPVGITPEMTPQQVIDLLKQQFPQIWNPTDPDAKPPLEEGVLQKDGTITKHIYIPVPTPDGGVEGQPETSPNTPEKPDPDNPTSTKYITEAFRPTPDPTDTPEPGTGKGNTPPAVLPTGSADALYKIYNPTNAQIQSFGSWLWSSAFVDQILKLFNDPMQSIISLHKIYATPHIGGTATIKVGYLDSQVPSDWVDQQYIEVDCGSVSILETSGNVIDYMSDIRIYLPFIGIVNLDVADVMRGVVGVKYRIDVITGTLVAFVSITRDAGAGGVIYQYTGSMAESYPLSSGSFMGIITGVLGIAAGVAGTVATGGLAAPALLGAAAGISAMHTKVEHSNGFSGNAGALAAKKPYIIISRPQASMSNGIGGNIGWPANYFVRLSQCSGYTRVKSIHLSGISGATDTELSQIETLLKEGVII